MLGSDSDVDELYLFEDYDDYGQVIAISFEEIEKLGSGVVHMTGGITAAGLQDSYDGDSDGWFTLTEATMFVLNEQLQHASCDDIDKLVGTTLNLVYLNQ